MKTIITSQRYVDYDDNNSSNMRMLYSSSIRRYSYVNCNYAIPILLLLLSLSLFHIFVVVGYAMIQTNNRYYHSSATTATTLINLMNDKNDKKIQRHGTIAPHMNRKFSLISSLSSSNNNNKNNNKDDNINKGFNILGIASSIIPQGPIVTVVSESWKMIWKTMMIELAPQSNNGTYIRPKYTFNNYIKSNTNHNNNEQLQQQKLSSSSDSNNKITHYPDEPGRYHIYTGNTCPWCHRVVLTMKLMNYNIPQQIGWTILDDNPKLATRGGWIFNKQQPDYNFGDCSDLYTLYHKLVPNYNGRCTLPLLIDIKTKTIISNESSDIVRMLHQIRLGSTDNRINLLPNNIDINIINETNEWIYQLINNGVYRCGFATTQLSFNNACEDVLYGFNKCNSILKNEQYINGDVITESDIMLLPTILRYDIIYSSYFLKNSIGTIQYNYPYIHQWLCNIWNQYPTIHNTIDFNDARQSYYKQLFPLNPSGIIPYGIITPESIGLISTSTK